MFDETFLCETPATDPSQIVGRTLGVRVPQLTNDKTKGHLKLIFKIGSVNGNRVSTFFNGLACSPEYVYRNIRSGLQKMEAIDYIDTKDGWNLQVTASIILNKKCEFNIQKQSRKFVIDFLRQEASKSSLDEFVKNVVAGSYQKKIKKDGSRIYPVRFFEISKIEVHKMPAELAVAAPENQKEIVANAE